MRLGLCAILSLVLGCGGSTNDDGGSPSGGGAGGTGAVTGGGSGGTGAGTTGGTGGSGATGATGGTGASGGAGGSGGLAGGTTFAIDAMFLGDTDTAGFPSATAWQNYGYDIDGLITTPTSTDHCQLQPGTPGSYKTDGNAGIDNSFGRNLMPIIQNLAANPTQALTESINDGTLTWLFRSESLDISPTQTQIDMSLFGGSERSAAPLWDGTDVWPITYESLTGGNLNTPKVFTADSSVTNGTWTSGPAPLGTPLVLNVNLQGFDLPLAINVARISMIISGGVATDGMISGVLGTDALVAELKKVAGGFDPGLCSGPTFESIADQIRAASDIMADGSNGDASQICDGISLGIGFTAKSALIGPVAAPITPPVDPCAGN